MDFSVFSWDETTVLVVSAVIGFTLWGSWYSALGTVTPLATPKGYRGPLYFIPLISIAFLYFILQFFASSDVRSNLGYVLLYLLLGIAWMRIALGAFLYMGLSVRDDLVERRNRAAAIAVAGALIGITLCYAGGNIGEGPSWLVVVFSAFLSTAGFFVLWIAFNAVVGVTETVTIGRDDATAIRLAAFFIGAGVILGRAVAGNWVSTEATVLDFVRFGWPVAVVFVVAVIGEFLFRPTQERPVGSVMTQGIFPAIAYIALSLILVYIFTLPIIPASPQ